MVLKDRKADWASCQKYIRDNVKAEDYEKLFAFVEFDKFMVAENCLVLRVPNPFIREQIEKHFLDVMRIAIYNTFGKINLYWNVLVIGNTEHEKGKKIVEESEPGSVPYDIVPKEQQQQSPAVSGQSSLPPIDSQLHPQQTFRSFIEGDSNKLSRSIGMNVAEHPNSTQFNPMFIFGPSGCGKTHLVNAIGNRCCELYPTKRVLYVSARTFQAQYVTATQQGKINDFIAFYQTIDMLIVDDVQEWMKATSTQDTFFHIFNHLHRNGRRIILVSDRAPIELEGMNKRLVTRFACGMTAEMEKPNFQLCVDILRRKIARDGLVVPDDVVQFIAQTANGSIRELEGVIMSLLANSIVYHCNIDMNLVNRVVKRAVKVDDMPLTVDDILDRVCRKYEVTQGAVKSRSRKKELVIPRQLSMYLADKYTNIPVTRIGKLIGSRDHSTVLHSIAKVEEMIQTDSAFMKTVDEIVKALKIKS
ncbi:MAG: chromosomal replication initiator protein DnaA [Prevotella sp.]|nr:chromosomal replication initiator protein DnaA [Prevotella sp.]MBR6191524.1 chromosomal replication initiator protein DnaA [Prevotella sp.]